MDAETKASIDAFKAEMKRRSEMVHSNLGRSVTNACQLVENTAKLGMKNTETDPTKAYKRGTGTHYASQEGSYAAVDYGPLIQSITHSVEQDGSTVVGRVGTNFTEGLMTELGTSKMAPRPWLRPSLEVNRDKIHDMIVSAISGREVEISTETGE
jgi:hypothetical protein